MSQLRIGSFEDFEKYIGLELGLSDYHKITQEQKKYRKKLKTEFLGTKPLMGVLTILNNAENKIFIKLHKCRRVNIFINW